VAALRSPPRTVREVERAETWLDPATRGAALDAARAFAPLRAAVEAATKGPADAPAEPWTVQASPVVSSALETQLALLPEEERRGALDALEEGQVLVLSRGETMVAAFVGRFAGAQAAARFVALDVRVSRAKDEALKEGLVRIASATYAEGVGKDAARPGTRIAKEVRVGSRTQRVRVVMASVGAHAIEVTAVDVPDLGDDALAAAVEEVCRGIEALAR
jgi:hypothetical protein